MSSSYPPGHPTGVARGEDHESVWFCETCNTMWTSDQLSKPNQIRARHERQPICDGCHRPMVREYCDRCDNVATHIDVDQAVNAAIAYCPNHHM